MFKDRNEELQRLEQALLEEDETMVFTPVEAAEPEEDMAEEDGLLAEETLDELLDDVAPGKASVAYQNFSNDYGKAYTAYNSDVTDEDLDEYCEQVLEPPKPSYTGLVILACLLALGILGFVIFMLLRAGGFL